MQEETSRGRAEGRAADPTVRVDAYAHIGRPRFGSLAEGLSTWRKAGIKKTVAVLGPGVPDLESLAQATEHSDRLRVVGIPFGATPEQRAELTALQIEAGAIGIRLDRREAVENPDVLDLIGENGRWAFGIDPCADDEVAATYLGWLDRYPNARLVAPHFLGKRAILPINPLEGDGSVANLLHHPRFYAIFSRQGGVESREPYPHLDLLDWVHQVIGELGWERVLWGSEYPVLFWRNETLRQATHWLSELLPEITDNQLSAFLGGNAGRLFFSEPAPARKAVRWPGWVEQQFVRERTVPLFPTNTLDLLHSAYAPLLSGYLASPEIERGEGFAAYIARQLAQLESRHKEEEHKDRE